VSPGWARFSLGFGKNVRVNSWIDVSATHDVAHRPPRKSLRVCKQHAANAPMGSAFRSANSIEILTPSQIRSFETCLCKSGQGSGCGDDLAKRKQGFFDVCLPEIVSPSEGVVFLLFRQRGAVHRNGAVFAFIGAKRKPLTGEADGSGAAFRQEGRET
jgi:hypothetical protein